jgi:dephospho-CoA kinase
VLGVTGGIASGKSTVTRLLRALGAAVVSADELAREAVRPGSPALRQLVERFGAEILQADGTLDRRAMAGRVFSDAAARSTLNSITHPAIAALAQERIGALRRQGAPLIVYEAPLLFEAGAEKRVDAVLVVTLDERLQVARLMARDGLDEAQARARIAAQIPQAQKAARADYVIDNSGPPEATEAQVRQLLARLTGAAPRAPG